MPLSMRLTASPERNCMLSRCDMSIQFANPHVLHTVWAFLSQPLFVGSRITIFLHCLLLFVSRFAFTSPEHQRSACSVSQCHNVYFCSGSVMERCRHCLPMVLGHATFDGN